MTINKDKLTFNWATKKDIPQLLEINTNFCEQMWSRQEFADRLEDHKTYCFKVVKHLTIVGFVFYKLSKTGIIIQHLAVHPNYQKQGIGTMLLDKIKTLIKPDHSILYCIRDTNLMGQNFLVANGFLAIEVMKDYFCDEIGGEENFQDGYLFVYCFA